MQKKKPAAAGKPKPNKPGKPAADASYSVALLADGVEVMRSDDLASAAGGGEMLAGVAGSTMESFARGDAAVSIQIIEDDEEPHATEPVACGRVVGEVVFKLIVELLIAKQ